MSRYEISAKPTFYDRVLFRSRLEARWAAWFDLAGWQWEYEPIDFVDWSPDFRVRFHCGHSECNGSHVLLVEVKPFWSMFAGHAVHRYMGCGLGESWMPAEFCSSAMFGSNTKETYWSMAHGAGGGDECVEHWVNDHATLWKTAGNIVQWHVQGILR